MDSLVEFAQQKKHFTGAKTQLGETEQLGCAHTPEEQQKQDVSTSPLPPTLILPHQASGGAPAWPVTADNHGMMPRMGPRKLLTLLGESLYPWWPILGMTASSSLGTAAYSDGTWGH